MKSKVLTILLIVAAFSFLGFIRASSTRQQEKLAELEASKDRGTIRWHAAVAKAKGQTQVVLPSPPIEYSTAVRSLDEVLPYFAVVLAQPISKTTVVASSNEVYVDNEIRTWYKFRILENLSAKPIPKCSTCGDNTTRIPRHLLPVNPHEVLVETNGGSVDIDGVKVTVSPGEIPGFLLRQKYLLFLSTDSSGNVGLLRMGPIGIYKVDTNGILRPVSTKPHPFIENVRTRYRGSLELIRARIQK